ncbi:MarR family transcriptional regulator [Frateuria defendens]|uniref:MarR family transcriptional regulator n=1 Tax=Frateuria defendens TaxID=2219559 RepID=UPI00066FBFDD|nr:MarR family transcriptional regulator [Frateuria defendens]
MSSSFQPTEQRLAVTRRRHPAFPYHSAVLVRLVKHIYKRVHDDTNLLLKPWGINHPEYNLLMMLYGTEDNALYASQLSEAAGEKSANITRLTNELCRKGLIERSLDEGDRRKVALSLTEQGLATIESFLPAMRGLLDQQASGLTEAEMTQLRRLLKKFLDQLDRG